MKIYVHLDEDSTPLPPHTLKIDDASPLSVAAVIEQFSSAYASKVLQILFRDKQSSLTLYFSMVKADCPPPLRFS
jgi:hypothetical protein